MGTTRSETESRKQHLKQLGFDVQEYPGWRKNWQNVKDRATRHRRQCSLSFEEYTLLAAQAGITKADQIGLKPGNYQLGRFRDEGGYIMGNCRFIPKEENLRERWLYAK